jgi:hypothetical protein
MAISIVPARAEETFVWSGNVFSSGETVAGPVLEAGMQYRIVSKEIFWYNYTYGLEADAQYYTTHSVGWYWIDVNPAPGGHSFLQIDGMDVNWGPYTDTHTYSIFYIGTGAAINFRLVDWVDGSYENNNCHLPVEIYKSPRYYGLTPGFWKNHPEAWPTAYHPSDSLRSVFGNCAPSVSLMRGLDLQGGKGISGAKEILARAAVAALLNAKTFGESYNLTAAQVIEMVTYQFCNGDRRSIISLASDLDCLNNMGPPLGWP